MASSPRNGVRNTRIWLEPRTSWFTSPTGDSSTITRIRFRRGTVLPGMRSNLNCYGIYRRSEALLQMDG